jgi:N-acetylglucosaminylphosphatidylinositol deacetylase
VRTTGLWRKYTLLGDLPLTTLPFAWRLAQALVRPSSTATAAGDDDTALVANTWARYLATRRAFGQHATQYSWDRHLYMVLSRYVWFNDLRRVRRTAGGGGAVGGDGARRAWMGWLGRG